MNVANVVAFLASAALCVDGVRADSEGSGSVVIYVVIGVVVVLFIAAAVFVWMRKSNRKKDNDLPLHEPVQINVPAPPMRQNNSRNGSRAQQQQLQQQQQYQQQQHHQQQQLNLNAVPAAGNQNYQGYASPHMNGDRRDRPAGNYQEPRRPERPVQPRAPGGDNRANPNPNPNAPPQPRQPRSTPNGGAGKPQQRPQRANETATRVLAEFQTDPALCRRKIPYAALYFTRVLSKGAFGEVWLAQLENRQVAVKRILNEKKNDEKEIECFAAEIKLMASFYHPKIVEFVGVSWSTLQDLCAVTEYMAKGDLYGFLKRKNGQLNWRDHKAYLAEDVADALGYLHSLSPKVIHRDLKSKNILLDDSFRAKLSDFGISRERSLEETMTAGVGTIYWTAPEVLMGKKYTEKADIYSFGIVMSELDTHDVPYSDLRDEGGKKLQGMKIVQQVIKKKLRPTFSSSCPTKVRELANRCLDSEPDVRPDALELLHLIQRIQQQL